MEMGWKKKLLFSSVIAGLCLIAIELVLRRAIDQPGFREFPSDQPAGLYVPHPTRLYTMASNFKARIETPSYAVDVSTNALGLRDDPVLPGSGLGSRDGADRGRGYGRRTAAFGRDTVCGHSSPLFLLTSVTFYNI